MRRLLKTAATAALVVGLATAGTLPAAGLGVAQGGYFETSMSRSGAGVEVTARGWDGGMTDHRTCAYHLGTPTAHVLGPKRSKAFFTETYTGDCVGYRPRVVLIRAADSLGKEQRILVQRDAAGRLIDPFSSGRSPLTEKAGTFSATVISSDETLADASPYWSCWNPVVVYEARLAATGRFSGAGLSVTGTALRFEGQPGTQGAWVPDEGAALSVDAVVDGEWRSLGSPVDVRKDGTFTVTVPSRTAPGKYRVEGLGSPATAYGATVSFTVARATSTRSTAKRARAKVRLTAVKKVSLRGGKVRLQAKVASASVTRLPVKTRVFVQKRTTSGWTTIKKVRAGRSGKVQVTVKTSARGATYRFFVPKTARVSAARSAAIKVRS